MLVIVQIDAADAESPTAVATLLAEVAVVHELVVVCTDPARAKMLAGALRSVLPRFSVVAVVTDVLDVAGLRLVVDLVGAGSLPVLVADGEPTRLVAELERRLRADMLLELASGPQLRWYRQPAVL